MRITEQPGAFPPMQPGGDRNAKELPMIDGHREWSNGLFTCLEDSITFFFACCLPCVIYSKNKTRYESLQDWGVPHSRGGVPVGRGTITYGVMGCCYCGGIPGMPNRRNIRGRYSIRGSSASDFFLSCCCAPCALTQESRELELEERSLGHPGGGMSYLTQLPPSLPQHPLPGLGKAG
ncbi:hypothetical protein BOTBODRAFT_284093 [Botryobasidium botryosum FD-172 SS1]|uniref:PLAC8-domain-containing protein n=1 Tax=Botryobasidium botryosum (strain FD-172 SS1) TaxID=930990 RepID=A0A067MIP7_BOTB1|nr:hypothetical protein BOTBODRAFT_284093 [Botryobasidium botryosum FD-172 SS1]